MLEQQTMVVCGCCFLSLLSEIGMTCVNREVITLNLHGSVQENLTSLDNCRARRIRYEWLILILILVITEHSGYLFHLRYIPSIATGDSQRLSISWSIEIHGIAKLSLCNRHLEDPWSRICHPLPSPGYLHQHIQARNTTDSKNHRAPECRVI